MANQCAECGNEITEARLVSESELIRSTCSRKCYLRFHHRRWRAAEPGRRREYNRRWHAAHPEAREEYKLRARKGSR